MCGISKRITEMFTNLKEIICLGVRKKKNLQVEKIIEQLCNLLIESYMMTGGNLGIGRCLEGNREVH
jgi:hypothetical protein